MAIPDAVLAVMAGVSDLVLPAQHPQAEAWYDHAVLTLNAGRWGGLYTQALGLATAHYCLTFPPSSAGIDRTPVTSDKGLQESTSYVAPPLDTPDSFWMTTAPGRAYLSLRGATMGRTILPVVV